MRPKKATGGAGCRVTDICRETLQTTRLAHRDGAWSQRLEATCCQQGRQAGGAYWFFQPVSTICPLLFMAMSFTRCFESCAAFSPAAVG
jgi:hypothetical protein